MGSSTQRAKDSAQARGLQPGTALYRLRVFLDLVRFEHTIFALPFAYIGMVLAAGGLPALWDFVWVTVAMAAARTLAFAVNRLADRAYDARNPRTMNRPTVTGTIDARTVTRYAAVSLAVLLIAAALLDPLALALAPVAVLFLVGYSFTKRFTVLAHWVLGFTDALAVGGGWIAVRGSFFTADDLPAWLLIGAVTFWIAGFDLIYACQDTAHDIAEGLHAWPARFGNASALRAAKLNHIVFLILLVLAGWAAGLAWPYYLAAALTAALLIYEHRLVSPDDLSRVNVAFFNMNSYIAVTLLAGTLAALLI
ncbi:MAG: UbiA family prenyltransferase [Chloroflexi bacterium]|nr:UbiA family prenyltransferase [Chloroflexota bacterium]